VVRHEVATVSRSLNVSMGLRNTNGIMTSESEQRGLDPNTTLELGLEDVQLFDRLEESDALEQSEEQAGRAPTTFPDVAANEPRAVWGSPPANGKAAAAPNPATSASKEQDLDPNTTLELTLDDLEVEDLERPA
jgi:hypothetical protein